VCLPESMIDDVKSLGVTFRKLHRQFGHTEPKRLAKTVLQAYPQIDKEKLQLVVDATCRVWIPEGEHSRG